MSVREEPEAPRPHHAPVGLADHPEQPGDQAAREAVPDPAAGATDAIAPSAGATIAAAAAAPRDHR